jgi:hypothetical protein
VAAGTDAGSTSPSTLCAAACRPCSCSVAALQL